VHVHNRRDFSTIESPCKSKPFLLALINLRIHLFKALQHSLLLHQRSWIGVLHFLIKLHFLGLLACPDFVGNESAEPLVDFNQRKRELSLDRQILPITQKINIPLRKIPLLNVFI